MGITWKLDGRVVEPKPANPFELRLAGLPAGLHLVEACTCEASGNARVAVQLTVTTPTLKSLVLLAPAVAVETRPIAVHALVTHAGTGATLAPDAYVWTAQRGATVIALEDYVVSQSARACN